MGFQKVEEILSHVGGKVLVFGKQGTGKSTFVGTFPNINLVDTEDGQTYYLGKNKNIKGVMRTVSEKEVQETLDELNDEDMLKTFDTIVIDSGTKLYENMQSAAYEVAESRARKQRNKGNTDIDLNDINISQRDWGHIKRWNQQLATSYILFSEMGKWCVVTAHQKDETRDATKAEKKALNVDKIKIGEIPDLAKKAEHDFDIVIQTFTEETDDGETVYKAKILKDRTGVTKRGDILENITFEIWRKNWEDTKKYGIKAVSNLNDSVEKDVKAMTTEADNAEDIVEEWKPLMKKLTASGNTSAVKQINAFIKKKGLNIKNMTAESPEILAELLDLTKSLS